MSKADEDRAYEKLIRLLTPYDPYRGFRNTFPHYPEGLGVGEITAWGLWLNYCPEGPHDGHLWASKDEQPVTVEGPGDFIPAVMSFPPGMRACPDHDASLPNSQCEDHVYHFGWKDEWDEDDDSLPPPFCGW